MPTLSRGGISLRSPAEYVGDVKSFSKCIHTLGDCFVNCHKGGNHACFHVFEHEAASATEYEYLHTVHFLTHHFPALLVILR